MSTTLNYECLSVAPNATYMQVREVIEAALSRQVLRGSKTIRVTHVDERHRQVEEGILPAWVWVEGWPTSLSPGELPPFDPPTVPAEGAD